MSAGPELSDAEVEELLGAYALDACEPDEAAAIEAVLSAGPTWPARPTASPGRRRGSAPPRRREPPPRMRADVLAAAAARRHGTADPAIDVYLSLSERFERAVDDLPDAALDVVTPNGLTAHDLVVHLAAQESLLAQNLGVPTFDDVDEEQIVARTDAFLPRFADRDLTAAVDALARVGRGEPGLGGRQPRPHRDLARPRAHPRRHVARAIVRGLDPRRRPAGGGGAADDAAGHPPPVTHVRPRRADPAPRAGGGRPFARRRDRTSGAHGRRWWRVAGRDGLRRAPARRPT